RLQVHGATLRKALGAIRDLIKTVPGRGYLLVASASSGPDLVPVVDTPAVAAAPVAVALPDAPASPLLAPIVGRDAELAQIVDMLERTPVVTLVGAGGIGK
ncbi:transcriptional regulator, partial [Burkholderia sola]|nr:transcriptional regulator [Burkholderia sola]